MEKIIVTSGQPFTDIDALACAVAYSDLLEKQGKVSETVLPGPLNKTITKKVKKWNYKFKIKPTLNNAKYVLVDISESDYFANFVKENEIVEVYDHRHGFEDFWNEKLGKNAHIEMVGACATLVWEEHVKRGVEEGVSKTSSRLLATAIISNTLNFQAMVTTKRDHRAYEKLKVIAKLPTDWVKTYFTDQDKETKKDIRKAIINDTKNLDPIIGQLELWDSKSIVLRYQKEIEEVLMSFNRPNWFLTAPSISEGKNYLFTKVPEMKKFLKTTINAKFIGDIGTTDKLWLRKEIIKKIK